MLKTGTNSQLNIKTVLLIGGNGFIGKAIERSFNKEEEWRTLSLDRAEIDLTQKRSIKALKKIYEKIKPDSIVVLAAIKRQEGDGQSTKEANNKITVNVKNSLENYDNQVIYFSSCAVYGEKNQQVAATEESPINPTSKYGEHKVFSEESYKNSKPKNDKLLILRPPLIYSEEEEHGYNPGGFLASARAENQISLWGDGKELREFIHVDDIAKIAKMTIKKNCSGVYNLVSGTSYTYHEIANYIKCELSKENQTIYINNKSRTGPKVDHTYDNRHLKKVLGDYNFIKPEAALQKKIQQNRAQS